MKKIFGFPIAIFCVFLFLLLAVAVLPTQKEAAYARLDVKVDLSMQRSGNYTGAEWDLLQFSVETGHASRTVEFTWYMETEDGPVQIPSERVESGRPQPTSYPKYWTSYCKFTNVAQAGIYYCIAKEYYQESPEQEPELLWEQESRHCFAFIYPDFEFLTSGQSGFPGDVVLDPQVKAEEAVKNDVGYAWWRVGAEEQILGTDATFPVTETGSYRCTISYLYRYWDANRSDYVEYLWSSRTTIAEVTVEGFEIPEITGGRVNYGESVILDATMSDTYGVPFTYAWYRAGTADPVGTDPVLTVDRPALSGQYKCKIFYGENYSTFTNEVTVTINKVRINVTIDDKVLSYGDPEEALTYTRKTALIGTDTDEDFAAHIVLSREEGKDVGVYSITGTSDHDCYSIRFTNGIYTIEKREIDVTVVPVTVRYGDAERPLLYQVESALAAGDTQEDLHVSLARRAGNDAGSYPISATYDNDNYDVTFSAAKYTILPRQVHVRIVGLTDLVYSGQEPYVLYELIAPPAGVTLALTIDYDREVKDAGDYVATIGFDDKNYEPYTPEYPFTVAKAPLVVSMEKCIVRQGGTPEPTYQYRGFILGEDERVLTETPLISVSTANVGVYEATPYGASADNYEISYRTGVVQVDYNGTTADVGEVDGAFSPDKPVTLYEGGEGNVGFLVKPVRTYTVEGGTADTAYIAKIYDVPKYPKIFLRAAIIDEEGNRHEVRSVTFDDEGNLVYAADYTGTFVLYYDLLPPAIIVLMLILLVIIILIVVRKDKKKYKRIHNRQQIAHQYVRTLTSRLDDDGQEE